MVENILLRNHFT